MINNSKPTKVSRLLRKPALFRRLTGLSPEKFKELLRAIEPLYNKAERVRLERTRDGNKRRKMNIAVGGKFKLQLDDRLFLAILYLRTGATHAFLGMLFGLDDGTTTRNINAILPLCKAVGWQTIKRQTVPREELASYFVVDATEQETERRSGTGYSGKKKRQTLKVQIVSDDKGRVRHVSSSVQGALHDKLLFDRTPRISVSAKTPVLADLGYLGTSCSIPHKSSKLHPLTVRQKKENVRHARRRIVVEHVIAHLKQWKILAHRWHLAAAKHHDYFLAVAGLKNLMTV